MKKSFLFLTLLCTAAFTPLSVRGTAGYLYESDNSTGTIFQYTTTSSGTLAKFTFASGLTDLRDLRSDCARSHLSHDSFL
jgi:hypothetical protein